MIILCTRNTIYVHQLVLDECKRWRAGVAKRRRPDKFAFLPFMHHFFSEFFVFAAKGSLVFL